MPLDSPLARHIVYLFREALIQEDFKKYLIERKDIFENIPENVTVADLINLTIKHLDFDPKNVDELVCLGIIVEELLDFIRNFLNIGLYRKISEDKIISSKWNDQIQKAMQQILDREAIIIVIDYLQEIMEQSNLEESPENWKYPSLKPYAIKAMFCGRKLADCVKLSL